MLSKGRCGRVAFSASKYIQLYELCHQKIQSHAQSAYYLKSLIDFNTGNYYIKNHFEEIIIQVNILDFADIIRQIVLLAFPVLTAVTFHELAHGYVADKLGDPTARLAGRLTINPLKHLDLVGTLVFVITRMIGWAKPVPVNPYNLRNPKKDMIWVSLAGPAANLIIAFIAAVVFRLLLNLPVSPFSDMGQKILAPLILITRITVTINIGLGVFNLIPVPPLDGSKILMGLLPHRQAAAYSRIEPYGFFILLGLIFLRVTDYIIVPIIILIRYLLLGQ